VVPVSPTLTDRELIGESALRCTEETTYAHRPCRGNKNAVPVDEVSSSILL
jgi:hypothetical protein